MNLQHCAEKLTKPPGGDSYLFSLYTSAVVTRYKNMGEKGSFHS